MANSAPPIVAAAQKLLKGLASFKVALDKTPGALPRELVDALNGSFVMLPALLEKVGIVHGVATREAGSANGHPPIVDAAQSLRMELISFGAVLDAAHGALAQELVDDLRAAIRMLPDLLDKVRVVYGVPALYGAPAREAAYRADVFRETIAAVGMTFSFSEDD